MFIIAGKIIAFRLFNVGETIDLNLAARILESHHQQAAFTIGPKHRSMLIVEHPLSFTFDSFAVEIRGRSYQITPTAKIWSFGTLSLQYALPLEETHSILELNYLGNFLETSESFSQQAVNFANTLLKLLTPAIEKPELWRHWEDYLVFSVQKLKLPAGVDLKTAFLTNEVASLILTEEPMEFAPKVVARLEQYLHQYGTDDLLLLHWNGALIYDPLDAHHLQETIEYALCQLLELRYYDQLLENQLKFLYQKIENRKQTIFSNIFGELARQAALEYIDISVIVDQVENAFKVTGDFYFASIFKAAARELQIPEWRKSVSAKLNNLAEISKIFQGEINERRSQIMEIIIILLITAELISTIQKIWN